MFHVCIVQYHLRVCMSIHIHIYCLFLSFFLLNCQENVSILRVLTLRWSLGHEEHPIVCVAHEAKCEATVPTHVTDQPVTALRGVQWAARLSSLSAEWMFCNATLPPNLLISSSSLFIHLAPGGWSSYDWWHLTSRAVRTSATSVEYSDLSKACDR